MKLKNEALEKLYGTIVNSTITISPFSESPIDEAFKECDRELANLQNRNDILEKSNGTLLDANLDLCSKNRDLKKDLDEAKSSANYFRASRDNWRSRAKHEEEEKNEQVNKALGEKFQLQREVEQLKKDLDALLSRTHCAEDEVEQLKKDRDIWVRNNGKKQAEIAELKRKLEAREEELDTWTRKQLETTTQFDELTSQYQKLSIENKRLQYDYNTLHKKYSECEATVDKQAEQIRHLKAKQDSVHKNCYDQGQTDLWVKLQDVKDMQPNEFDTECECLGDVIDMDLEDFLDVYKNWWEQKETDRMRNWLADFCFGRVCEGCPLESEEYKCGCGYSFKMTDPFDTRIIPDEDIKRYYEKAVGHRQYALKDANLFVSPNMEGVNKAISKFCENFCKAVRDADIKIKENIPRNAWECTLKAKFDVNKDLLDKVCGMKSEDEKPNPKGLVITTRGVTTANYTEATMNAIKEAVRRLEKSLPELDSWESTITGSIKVDDILGKTDDTEHKLEYGDAVRVSWSNFDYMYVGPDEHRIRLFDPKYHCVIFVSSTEKLTYQGSKIIIFDEDDLRKIWKDKG